MTDAIELAKRAVKCKAWRWMRGMSVVSDTDHDAIVWHDKDILYLDPDDVPGDDCIDSGDLPDLTDPATLGCLLHLIKESWGVRSIGIEYNKSDGKEYFIVKDEDWEYSPTHVVSGDTEEEALVKALEMEIPND
jgi:hypothetical protein